MATPGTNADAAAGDASKGTGTDPSEGPAPSVRLPASVAAMLESKTAPICTIVVGMAGSGKTTLMQRLLAHCHMAGTPSYSLNLDPAAAKVPYGANIDIRGTVNYKEVMKQYQLGPNGAIMTSLNLFATRFDQVIGLMEKRAAQVKYVLAGAYTAAAALTVDVGAVYPGTSSWTRRVRLRPSPGLPLAQ